MLRLVLVILLFLTTSCATVNNRKTEQVSIKSAQEALAAGDYPKAYELFSDLEEETPLAQFILGQFYQNGWGRPVNQAEACRWFEKASANKVPLAMHYLGDCLAQGIGRPADGKAAIESYLQAAEAGDSISWCLASDLYMSGKGVAPDPAKGVKLCEKATQTGSPVAMVKLANYYREGIGLKQDLAKARQWFQRAAENRYPEALYQLGVMLSEGQGGEVNLDKALYCLETAAGMGYAPAYLSTAILYTHAKPDPKTGLPLPEVLAKIYFWNSVAKARATEPAQLAEISKIDAMVSKIMPDSWRPELDKRVTEQLAAFK